MLHHLVDARKRTCSDLKSLLESVFNEYKYSLIEVLVDFEDEVRDILEILEGKDFEFEVVEREDGFSVLLKRSHNFFLEVL
ncbi:hypothetical protein SAMN05661008_00601 [Alkalithermobacter thermoalcaliphilus JW-YL-7 = DSM 7308]|uniref:SirA family protein n=1 Tax=Alkalithermobacter thermoalcaliphilus JW-YL-7 = DSM 7308 TaxID=1121328 RepID=A0A150FQ30_CLOPD|nr:SirA family protein [[Clostridium] paradoxum JW-YL-7 = DSM 7308]SHK63403.1 hypothetical protein SAMN05661008_00601 [[Clostridium] paradoxum JW-YL-7 = DSM 7308]